MTTNQTSPDGHGTIAPGAGGRRTIAFERLLPAPIADVWAALTDPDQLAKWLTVSSFEPAAGGHVDHWFDGDDPNGHCEGTVLVWEPPAVVEYEWRFPGEEQSVLRFELTSEATALTRLRLEHRLLGHEHATGYGAGWHAHLDRLAAVLAGADPPSWDERFMAVRGNYAPPG